MSIKQFLSKSKNKEKNLKSPFVTFHIFHFPSIWNEKLIFLPTTSTMATNPCIYNLRMSSNCFFLLPPIVIFFFIIIKWKSNLTTIYFPCPPFPPFFISTQLLVDFPHPIQKSPTHTVIHEEFWKLSKIRMWCFPRDNLSVRERVRDVWWLCKVGMKLTAGDENSRRKVMMVVGEGTTGRCARIK